jgi:hypothetical protein
MQRMFQTMRRLLSTTGLLIFMAAGTFALGAYAQNTVPAPKSTREAIYEKIISPIPQWLTAYRTDAGYILDPVGELSNCPKALDDEINQRHALANGVLDAGLQHQWVHPVSVSLPVKQKTALTDIQKHAIWLVDESGVRNVRFSSYLARQMYSHGPCLNLSTFTVSEPKRVNISTNAEALVSTKSLPLGTRIVRARNVAHNAFNQLPATELGTTLEERAIAAWALAQPSLVQAFQKDLPKPEPKERYHLCVPSFQPFNASLSGQLRSMLSLRLQWCECQQTTSDAVGAACVKFASPYDSNSHWLAIVERRANSMGNIWISNMQSTDALQFMLVEGVITGRRLQDDILWIKDIHYEGLSTSLLQRLPKSTKLRSMQISSYAGL